MGTVRPLEMLALYWHDREKGQMRTEEVLASPRVPVCLC